jgi:DNA-binding NarL/FixJ family response regulator
MPIDVIVADDHVLFREGLCRLLSAEADMHVVGQASTGEEVLSLAAAYSGVPGTALVVLMDISMPSIDGIRATSFLAERGSPARVLALSALDDSDTLFAAIKAGAEGYALKDCDPRDLLRAIRLVAEGGAFIDPSITPRLLAGIRDMGYDHRSIEQQKLHLTDRELEILTGLATPSTPQQLALSLGISTKTVQNHISNIYRKLQVGSRTEAVMKALELHLISQH